MEHIIDNLYMLFSEGGFYFLLPLSDIKQVRERDHDATDLSEFNLSQRLHRNQTEEKYQIVLQREGVELNVAAERVFDIVNIDQSRFVPIDERAMNEKNQYLKAVVQNQTDQYPFDVAFLLEPFFVHAGTVDMEDQ